MADGEEIFETVRFSRSRTSPGVCLQHLAGVAQGDYAVGCAELPLDSVDVPRVHGLPADGIAPGKWTQPFIAGAPIASSTSLQQRLKPPRAPVD